MEKFRSLELNQDQLALSMGPNEIMLDLPADVMSGEREKLGQHFMIAFAIKDKLSTDKDFVDEMTNYAVEKLQVAVEKKEAEESDQ